MIAKIMYKERRHTGNNTETPAQASDACGSLAATAEMKSFAVVIASTMCLTAFRTTTSFLPTYASINGFALNLYIWKTHGDLPLLF